MDFNESWQMKIHFLGHSVTSQEGNRNIKMKCDFLCSNVSFCLVCLKFVSINDFINFSALTVAWAMTSRLAHAISFLFLIWHILLCKFSTFCRRPSWMLGFTSYSLHYTYSLPSFKTSKIIWIFYSLRFFNSLLRITLQRLALCKMQNSYPKRWCTFKKIYRSCLR